MTELKEPNLCTDDLFKQVGEFGKYQLLVFILVGFTSTMNGIANYQVLFTDATPEYRCKLPMLANDTYEITSKIQQSLVDLYIPVNGDKYDGCNIYSNVSTNKTSQLMPCSSWVYSKAYYKQTLVSEWNLVCTNLIEKGLYKSLLFAGSFSIILIGFLADRFGRKKTTYMFVTLNALSFLTMTLSLRMITSEVIEKVVFAASRFFIGFFSNVYAVATVLAVEIVGPSYRVTANNTMYYFFIFGELVVLFLAYFVRDFKLFNIYSTVIVTLLITYFWWIPESVRYLINRKRFTEADKIFIKIAESNKEIFTYSTEYLEQEREKKINYKAFFCNKKVLAKIFVSLVNWFSNSFVYYGISVNTDLLGGDPYLNFLYFIIVEFLGVLASHFILTKFGRKIPYLINYLIIAVVMTGIGFIPAGMNWLKISSILIVKFSISFNFNAIYVITTESYPTIIRNTAVSVCSIAARIASLLSPYIPLLGSMYFESLPYVIYGIVIVVSGLLFLIVMPETKDLHLPETLDDLCDEENASNQNGIHNEGYN